MIIKNSYGQTEKKRYNEKTIKMQQKFNIIVKKDKVINWYLENKSSLSNQKQENKIAINRKIKAIDEAK